MIEIELKYLLKHIPNLSIYELENDKKELDIYYDTKEYELIRNGNFLRVRNMKKIDFKLSMGDMRHLYCKETNFNTDNINEDFFNIFKNINVMVKNYNNFDDFIKKNRFIILATINKHRREYKITNNIRIIIDEIEDLGIFLEAEIMVDESEVNNVDEYKEQLISLLEEHKLITNNDKAINIGYVELYLQKYNKEVYKLGIYKN